VAGGTVTFVGRNTLYGGFAGSLSGRTAIASLLAPPRPPQHPYAWLVIPGLCAVLGAVLFSESETVGEPALGEAVIALAAVGIVSIRWMFQELQRYPAKIADYNSRMDRWRRLWYCHRCDTIFDPGTG
jgi:hypothetical protein